MSRVSAQLKSGIVKQQPDADLPLDSNVRTGRLANGFTYFIRHNEQPKNQVTLYLANKVGSLLENENQRGLAHFMEHMNFNGTKHFPKNELVNYLQQQGVRFGADINAYTSFDETVYQLPLPSDKPEVLQNGIQIIHDWAHGATLDPIEIDKERGVILEEERLGKGAQERMQRKYWPVILNNSRYANRVPIGLDKVLNTATQQEIKEFYQDWYRPDLQALIVVGDINLDQMERTIRDKFSDLKNPEKERQRTKYTIELTGKNQFVAVTDQEMTGTVIQVLIKQPGFAIKTASDVRLSFINDLINRMVSERYTELAVKANSPFLEGGASLNPLLGGLQAFNINVTPKPGMLEDGFKSVWREAARIKRFGFSQTELNLAERGLVSDMNAAMNERDKTASDVYVKEYLNYFLTGGAAPGIETEYALLQKYLPEISVEEINQLAKSYMKEKDRDILILAPDKEKDHLPREETVLGWMNAVESEQLMPHIEVDSIQPLLSSEPVKGKIVKEEKIDKLNVTVLTMGNGLKVILKPTTFRNGEIKFSAFAPGGTSVYNDADYESAKNAAMLTGAGGLGNHDLVALGKLLEGKQLSVSPYIAELYQGLNGYSSPNDLQTAFQLIYAYFTNPRKDINMFESIMARSRASLINRNNDPNSVFSDTVNAVLSNNNYRRTGPSLDKLNKIDLDKAYSIYKDRFSDAANFTFVFVGSFNVDTIKPLIEKYLGSLPAVYRNESFKNLAINMPEGVISKTVYKGSASKATVDLFFPGKFDYLNENVLQMEALKEILQIRLLERLREEESGVYSPAVYLNTAKLPDACYSFVVSFGCDPHNVKKLINSTMEEIARIKTDGPSQTNIDKFKAEYINSTDVQLQSNDFWLGYLSNQYRNQEAVDEISTYKDRLQKIDTNILKTAANKYLNGKNEIELVLMPENIN